MGRSPKINWEIITSKESDYQLKEAELNKLKNFYLKNKNEEIKNYNFSSLITDFKVNWNDYSKLTIDQQQILFYKKIGKYKAYLESISNDNQIIKNEFSNCFKYFKNINEIISKEKIKYKNQELKNYDELINGLLPTCTCGGNNEIEWVQQYISNRKRLFEIYSKFEGKQMYEVFLNKFEYFWFKKNKMFEMSSNI